MTRVAVYCQIDMEPLTIVEVPQDIINNWEAKSRWEGRVNWIKDPAPAVFDGEDKTIRKLVQVNITAWKYRFNAAYGWFLMVDSRDFADALKGDALTVNCIPEQAPGRHDHAMKQLMGVVAPEVAAK